MSEAFLGPPGTFTHQAALELCGGEILPVPDAATLFRQLDTGEVDGGVLPFDNTVNGPVMPTVDAVLQDEGVRIAGDLVLGISFDAFTTGTGDPTVAVSHPHALAQVRRFVADRGLDTRAVASTAAACEQLVDGEVAIAPAICGELYGLHRIAAAVEDNSVAWTHFLRFTKAEGEEPEVPGATGSLFVLRPERNIPGILRRILTPLEDGGLNLNNVITRPVAHSPGEYVFVLSVEGDLGGSVIDDLLHHWRDELHCSSRHLGRLTRRRAAGEDR